MFFIQTVLLTFIWFDIQNNIKYNSEGFFLMADLEVVMTRFTSAIVLHMVSEPEVRQAITLWKYAINHVKVSSSMVDLYTRLCGDRLPLPEDPSKLTTELLNKAFKLMKKFQIEHRITCRHEVEAEVSFLLSRCDATGYNSKQVDKNGKEVKISLMEKM